MSKDTLLCYPFERRGIVFVITVDEYTTEHVDGI